MLAYYCSKRFRIFFLHNFNVPEHYWTKSGPIETFKCLTSLPEEWSWVKVKFKGKSVFIFEYLMARYSSQNP